MEEFLDLLSALIGLFNVSGILIHEREDVVQVIKKDRALDLLFLTFDLEFMIILRSWSLVKV